MDEPGRQPGRGVSTLGVPWVSCKKRLPPLLGFGGERGLHGGTGMLAATEAGGGLRVFGEISAFTLCCSIG